ncbi:Homeodomain-like DNA binding domain-containing transcription factor [Phytophthora cinnamomi]|uniref:Homeodomain-like DNA binding domain-containing transcription factor n=1 Tax=Phytophthora cinnamomi TaxID=4785 RepID=UPI00355A9361|nr:Homeodomain-like DNA binding domain-containing transcription factor [Phytophthora cinnamomi]
MRLTKQQQLDLCAMRTREPTWSLAALGEWAREKFVLDKAPGKSSVKRILDNESSLKRIAVDFRCRKKVSRASMVALDSCLVEMVLYAEQEHVPISGRMLMILGRLYAEALRGAATRGMRWTPTPSNLVGSTPD